MADDANEHEELTEDDPFAVFGEWFSEADRKAYAQLGEAGAETQSQSDCAP